MNCEVMGPQKVDLYVYQGDDYTAGVKVLNTDGTPADLTLYTVQAQVRYAPADEDEEIVADLAPVITGEPGIIEMTIPKSVTSQMSGRYVWDMELVRTGSGETSTILWGDVITKAEVTR